jgi:hypothetical protein
MLLILYHIIISHEHRSRTDRISAGLWRLAATAAYAHATARAIRHRLAAERPNCYAADAWLAADPLPATWQPGTRLSLRGPLGHGFHLPATAHRVALAALDQSFSRLLPLVELALAQGAAVALCGMNLPAHLPSAVEVLPLEALPELAAWADYLALDLALAGLETLPVRLGLVEGAHPEAKIELLPRLPMPCGGLGECGICAVPVRKGWQPACTAGPVFDFINFL